MAVPVEHRHWHPVALATGVGAAPLAVQLLDQPLVLWRDAVAVSYTHLTLPTNREV